MRFGQGDFSQKIVVRHFHHPDELGELAVFFYDGALSRAVAFEKAMAHMDSMTTRERLTTRGLYFRLRRAAPAAGRA